MKLQYEISTVGAEQLRSVLRGVEREVSASDKRLESQRRSSSRTAAKEQAGIMHGPGRREQIASIRQTERAQSMAAARQMREQAAANRAAQRAVIAATKGEERAKIQAEKNVARARESLDRQRSRGLLQQHNESERVALRLSRGRRAMADRIGGGMARSVTGAVGTVAKIGGAAAGIAGGFAAADALREESSIRRGASVLANQAGKPGLKGQLAEEAMGVRGFSGSETLGSMGAFMDKTGDIDAARASIKGVGELALATNADFTAMGEAAGNAFNVIAAAIEDPQERIKALQKVMAGWAGQGNIGAIELKDMAQFGGRLGGASRKFAGDPADLLLSMGAMSQAAVSGGGASDAAEATTGVARFASDLTKKPAQKALASMGVNVFADKNKTKLRDPAAIVADILEKTKGSLPKGEEIMNAESGKVLGGFSNIFTKAEATKKGTGKAAVLGEFKRYKDAGLTTQQTTERANSRMEDPDKQIEEATKAFNHAVGSELLPAVTKLIPQFTAMIPNLASATGELAKFVGWFAQNPLAGVGVIVAASVAKDIAAAGIGKAVESTLMSMLAQTAMGGGLPVGAAGGLAGKAGAVGLAVGGIALAADQADSFGKENGGWDGFKGFLGVGTDKGRWGFEGIDNVMDRKAKEEAALRPKLKPPGLDAATPAGTPAAGSTAATSAAAAAGPGPAAEQQSAAATAHQKAAADLKDAAAALKAAAKAGPPASNRNAPIISPDRT